jgi:hypothetical protein
VSSPNQLPLAPIHTSIDETVQTNVTVVMGVIAVATLIFSLYHWRRTGKPTFLVLFVAGGLMMLFEPMVDTVGAVWFQKENAWVAFTLYGRPIPVWLCLTYFFYFGIGVGAGYLFLRRGVTRGQVWLMFGAGIAGDFLLETILLHYDTYIYYGDQPLVLLKFPLWWAPVNSLIVLVAAAVVYRFDDYLAGARQLLIIPIALTCSAAVNAGAGWPSWLVINSEMGWVPRQLGGLLTWVLALWFVSLVAGAVAKRATEPAAGRQRVPRDVLEHA